MLYTQSRYHVIGLKIAEVGPAIGRRDRRDICVGKVSS